MVINHLLTGMILQAINHRHLTIFHPCFPPPLSAHQQIHLCFRIRIQFLQDAASIPSRDVPGKTMESPLENTLPETNSSTLKSYLPKRKFHLPTIICQGRADREGKFIQEIVGGVIAWIISVVFCWIYLLGRAWRYQAETTLFTGTR